MKLVISLCIVFAFTMSKLLACELKKKTFLILSSPIALLLEELELIDSNEIAAISSFNPVKMTTRPRIGGGIFLSVKKLKEYDGSYIFFDESRELKRNLKRSLDANLIEIKTRGKDPFEVLDENIKILKPFLSGCDKKIEKIKAWSQKVKSLYLNGKENPWIFFLGKIEKEKLPKLIIGNDLFISFLKKNDFIKTYESELSYINYSEKKLNEYKNYQLIGLAEKDVEVVEVEKVSSGKKNLYYRGIFSQGIRQIHFLEKLKSVINDI